MTTKGLGEMFESDLQTCVAILFADVEVGTEQPWQVCADTTGRGGCPICVCGNDLYLYFSHDIGFLLFDIQQCWLASN